MKTPKLFTPDDVRTGLIQALVRQVRERCRASVDLQMGDLLQRSQDANLSDPYIATLFQNAAETVQLGSALTELLLLEKVEQQFSEPQKPSQVIEGKFATPQNKQED